MKRTFLGNLMFVGGLSNMQGFLARMREELEFLLDNYENGKYSKMKNDIGFHVNPDPSSTRFSTAWVGGPLSLFTSFHFLIQQAWPVRSTTISGSPSKTGQRKNKFQTGRWISTSILAKWSRRTSEFTQSIQQDSHFNLYQIHGRDNLFMLPVSVH